MTADAFYGMLTLVALSVVAIIFALAEFISGQAWSWLLASAGVFGMYLAGSKKTIGWFVGIAIQPVWIAYAIATDQYGFIFSAVAYASVYIRNYIKWLKDEKRKEVPA